MPKIDFYFMHNVNSAIFYPKLLGASSALTEASKKRLLEYKIRMDIGMYASRRSPDLHLESVRDIKARSPIAWGPLFRKICKYPDDGHASKLLRAVAAAEQQSCLYRDNKNNIRIEGEDFLDIGQLVMDSIEGQEDESEEPRWARSVGFDEAWERVADRFVAAL